MTVDGFLAFARALPEPMALADERGRVLGFGARALGEGQQPKYIVSGFW